MAAISSNYFCINFSPFFDLNCANLSGGITLATSDKCIIANLLTLCDFVMQFVAFDRVIMTMIFQFRFEAKQNILTISYRRLLMDKKKFGFRSHFTSNAMNI